MIHIGEPSAHVLIEGVHTLTVQNAVAPDEGPPVASFIAVLMPLRQADVSAAHIGVHGVGVQLDLVTA